MLSTLVFFTLINLGCASPHAEEMLRVINHPDKVQEHFADSAIEALGADKLKSILANVLKQVGKAQSLREDRQQNKTPIYAVTHSRGASEWMLVFNDKRKVIGLQILGTRAEAKTSEQILNNVQSLPGKWSLHFENLSRGKEIISYRRDTRISVASVAKIAILKEIARMGMEDPDIYQKTLLLKEHQRSLPSGQIQNWPAGSPITIHTLATMMISISDNTATDMLLEFIGRQNLERSLRESGLQAGFWSVPFQSTREAFYFMALSPEDIRQKELNTVSGRRRELERISRLKAEEIEITQKPGSDLAGWGFSANDVIRLLSWFTHHKNEPAIQTALEIMKINPGMRFLGTDFEYQGYKGGSQPGVFAMSFLLKKDGEWYALFAARNHEEPINGEKTMEVLHDVVGLMNQSSSESSDSGPSKSKASSSSSSSSSSK